MAEGGSQEQSPVSGVAERYATALFELASEAKMVDAVAKDLDGFAAMIAESDDLKRLIESPAFSAQDQVSAITALTAKVGIAGLAANFIGFVASKRRLFALPGMIQWLQVRKVAEAKGIVSAEVTARRGSPRPPSGSKEITRRAEGAWPARMSTCRDQGRSGA